MGCFFGGRGGGGGGGGDGAWGEVPETKTYAAREVDGWGHFVSDDAREGGGEGGGGEVGCPGLVFRG